MSEVIVETASSNLIVSSQQSSLTVAAGVQGPAGATPTIGFNSPIVNASHSSGEYVVAFDQSAQNTTNDARYARLAAANAFTVGGHTITNAAAAVVPLSLRQASGQSAPMFAVTSAGSASNITWIDAFGRMRVTDDATGAFSLAVTALSAATVGARIRGAASQTANLQEWQNSAGTVLSRIAPSGTMYVNGYATLNGYFYAQEENAGAFIRLTKQSTAAANPSSGQAKLYLRDGTTAGTLKLVVRAGTAGAETTILDNIPQS